MLGREAADHLGALPVGCTHVPLVNPQRFHVGEIKSPRASVPVASSPPGHHDPEAPPATFTWQRCGCQHEPMRMNAGVGSDTAGVRVAIITLVSIDVINTATHKQKPLVFSYFLYVHKKRKTHRR